MGYVVGISSVGQFLSKDRVSPAHLIRAINYTNYRVNRERVVGCE